jgi:hypothetical protein
MVDMEKRGKLVVGQLARRHAIRSSGGCCSSPSPPPTAAAAGICVLFCSIDASILCSLLSLSLFFKKKHWCFSSSPVPRDVQNTHTVN